MATAAAVSDNHGHSPYVLSLDQALRCVKGKPVAGFSFTGLNVEIRLLDTALWALVRREGRGGVAVRVAELLGPATCTLEPDSNAVARVRIESALGVHLATFCVDEREQAHLRITLEFTPSRSVRPPYTPRDLYMLDAYDSPFGAVGELRACQRGPNSGLAYFRLEEPDFGTVLYFQNYTALNPYFLATGTTPLDAVGGEWPELGYLMPQPSEDDEGNVLPAGQTIVLSDAFLAFRQDQPWDERDVARHFLQMLGAVYLAIDHPKTQFRDWLARSEKTLIDLDQAPEATIRHYGHRYIHPYTAAEYPDAMVQASIVAAIHDWGKWNGTPHPLEADFKSGLRRFFDPDLQTIRRYLPNVGDDKEADAVDSWYLYHPLLNLGILALDDDMLARELFLKSIDYAIKAAHHFQYCWPIQYDVTDFSVITETAADGRGQTDVAGIYAWVMLQAFQLTDDVRYLDEARSAVEAALGLGFHLNYQANLTAWGAAACMRLWRITNEKKYLQQTYVYLASFFHNCEIWESEIGHAAHFTNFMGVTCLQDAPYMAMYECFESFAAFERLLTDGGPDLDPAARLLVSEYCRYVLHRAWFYYPDALPPEAIATKQRESNGHIDRKLSFPVEDLYADGQPAGQVGQEIYGGGAAFIFATRSFHNVEGAPFRIYCDHFVRAMERIGENAVSLTLGGGEDRQAGLSIVRLKRRKMPDIRIATVAGEDLEPVGSEKDRLDYTVPADGRVILTWSVA